MNYEVTTSYKQRASYDRHENLTSNIEIALALDEAHITHSFHTHHVVKHSPLLTL